MKSLAIRIPTAKRILDFGCGTGWVLAEAEVSGNPLRVGVDYSYQSFQGIDGGSTRSRAEAIRVHLVLGDGLCLPFASASFDVVVGHVSMPYMNTRAALREIYRVLTPGGSFFLTFHSFNYLRQRLVKSVTAGCWKDVVYLFYLTVNALLNHFDCPQTQVWWKPSNFETVNTPRGVCVAARKAGFTQIRPERRTTRIFFHVTAQKPNGKGIMTTAPEPIYPAF